MTYFLIYSVEDGDFISNVVCGDRNSANKMCDDLEWRRGGLFIPVRFMNGVQVAAI